MSQILSVAAKDRRQSTPDVNEVRGRVRQIQQSWSESERRRRWQLGLRRRAALLALLERAASGGAGVLTSSGHAAPITSPLRGAS